MRDLGPSEVGGFGISSPEDLLCVEELALIPQRCTEVTVKFDDLAVAEYFEDQADRGRRPEEFGRIWIHTHPGNSAQPSEVDVETFGRCFGRCDWGVMCILAQGGDCHAELHWRTGNARLPLRVEIDYARPFAGTEIPEWEMEYLDCVRIERPVPRGSDRSGSPSPSDLSPDPWGGREPDTLVGWDSLDRTGLALEDRR